jgi:hypothetical protein
MQLQRKIQAQTLTSKPGEHAKTPVMDLSTEDKSRYVQPGEPQDNTAEECKPSN